MDLKSTIDYLNHYLEEDERRPITFAVEVFRPGSIGGTPSVEIKRIRAGFDWDQGKMLLTPAQPLTTLSPEDVEAIRQDIKKAQSPAGYQMYKAHKEKVDALQARIKELEARPAIEKEPRIWSDGAGRYISHSARQAYAASGRPADDALLEKYRHPLYMTEADAKYLG